MFRMNQRLLAAGLLFLPPVHAGAQTLTTTICIKNKTSDDQKIETPKSFLQQWTGRSPLGQNFDNATIKPGETLCQNEELDFEKPVPKFTLVIGDTKSSLYYYNNFKNRHGWASDSDWSSSTALYGEVDYPFASSRLKRGFLCAGTECYLFTIGK